MTHVLHPKLRLATLFALAFLMYATAPMTAHAGKRRSCTGTLTISNISNQILVISNVYTRAPLSMAKLYFVSGSSTVEINTATRSKVFTMRYTVKKMYKCNRKRMFYFKWKLVKDKKEGTYKSSMIQGSSLNHWQFSITTAGSVLRG